MNSLSLLMTGLVPEFNNYLIPWLLNYIFGVKVVTDKVGDHFHNTSELLAVLIIVTAQGPSLISLILSANT